MAAHDFVAEADLLIRKAEAVLRSALPDADSTRNRRFGNSGTSDRSFLDYPLWSEWHSQAESFIVRVTGERSTYTAAFKARADSRTVAPTSAGLGILRGLREDLASGRLSTLSEVVRADVFSDFLEMAEYLLAEGYKDASAVLGGGVLEEHVRLLCDAHGIPTSANAKPKKADTMNAELAGAQVYNKNQQKIITGWLGIRNDAAHGKYGEYTAEQVEQYLAGVRDFINRFPA